MVDFIFNKSVHEQFEAFDSGFHKVTGGQVLVSFLFHCLCWSKINQSWNLIKFLVQHWSVWWLLFIYFFFLPKVRDFFLHLVQQRPLKFSVMAFAVAVPPTRITEHGCWERKLWLGKFTGGESKVTARGVKTTFQGTRNSITIKLCLNHLQNCAYKGDYCTKHQTIQLFWEAFRELSHEQKKKFLSEYHRNLLFKLPQKHSTNSSFISFVILSYFVEFLTGCDRIPIYGMKSIKVRWCFVSSPHDACFNTQASKSVFNWNEGMPVRLNRTESGRGLWAEMDKKEGKTSEKKEKPPWLPVEWIAGQPRYSPTWKIQTDINQQNIYDCVFFHRWRSSQREAGRNSCPWRTPASICWICPSTQRKTFLRANCLQQ